MPVAEPVSAFSMVDQYDPRIPCGSAAQFLYSLAYQTAALAAVWGSRAGRRVLAGRLGRIRRDDRAYAGAEKTVFFPLGGPLLPRVKMWRLAFHSGGIPHLSSQRPDLP
jgi:hypothetical protein